MSKLCLASLVHIFDRGGSYITFAPTVSVSGTTLSLMMIIKTLHIASELSSCYCLSDNHWGLIASAYMNQERFVVYLEQILWPAVKVQRVKFGLLCDAPALLILDGCLAHSKEMLDNISYHFLVPHSSHLMQALDHGVLPVFK